MNTINEEQLNIILENHKHWLNKDCADWENMKAIEAYLAELKAGYTQWHDLRKDPKDLPKYNSTVLDENGDKIVYIGDGKWEVYSEYYERYTEVDQPIAWCEVPTFEE